MQYRNDGRKVIEVDPSAVRALERNEVIAYHDAALPCCDSKVFNLPKTGIRRMVRFMSSSQAREQMPSDCRRSDFGHREIVVRGIGISWLGSGIAGATDLGDER
jgi:hypothetical protein